MTYPTEWRPVPAGDDLPAEVYETRAAVDGVDWTQSTLADVGAAPTVDPALTFFPDVSQFQNPVDYTFSSPILSFRICDGDYFDLNAVTNWSIASRMLADPQHPLQLVWVYFFYRPGTWPSVDSYIRRVFGAPSFPDRVVAMIDCEGWGGQIVGNHSPELNQWATNLAAKTTTGQQSVVGYSYTSAFNEIWPQILPWIKRHTASYGTWDPGWYGWQYSGGTGTGGQPGWAHGAAPWPLCDMNVIQRPVSQILTDFGFTEDPMPTPQEIAAAVWAYGPSGTQAPASAFLVDAKNAAVSASKQATANGAAIAALPDAEQIAAAVAAQLPAGSGASIEAITAAFKDVLSRTVATIDPGL